MTRRAIGRRADLAGDRERAYGDGVAGN